MLGVLVATQVRQHPTLPVFRFNFSSDLPDYRKHLEDNQLVVLTEIRSRRHVLLRNNHNVNRPKGPSVMESKDIIGFLTTSMAVRPLIASSQ